MLRGASNRSAELSIVGHRLQLGHRHPHELVAQRHGDERVDLDLDRVHECTLAGGNKKKEWRDSFTCGWRRYFRWTDCFEALAL